ncbi:hypothetical protein EB796_010046 [Bugula neritina]|uniref:Roc domain-containing protein n=1 Tax=Bugula neritina TaxID=10212 RepID=A0A7J7K118_BUGNE|nr:hypothetical protein EB796_010046 [Bugula neritina]
MTSTQQTDFGLSSHRLMVLGDRGSGKSSLIKSLVSGVYELCTKPTDGVELTKWKPSTHSFIAKKVLKKQNIEDAEHITIELWDMTGRKCCWPIHQSYFTKSTTYLITFSWLRQESVEAALHFTKLVQQKVPGSPVILIGTACAAEVADDEVREKVRAYLWKEICLWGENTSGVLVDQMNRIRDGNCSPLALQEVIKYEDLLIKRPNITEDILGVDFQHHQGIEGCTDLVLRKVLQAPKESRLDTIASRDHLQDYRNVIQQLDLLRSHDQLIIDLSEVTIQQDGKVTDPLNDVLKNLPAYKVEDQPATESSTLSLKSNKHLIIEQLFSKGILVRLQVENSQYICIDPRQLANLSCLFHLDGLNRNLQLEANRFWPKTGVSVKPEPSLIVKALEEIPALGAIREVLFPLLWQEKHYSEKQIMLILLFLSEQNLLSRHVNMVRDEPAMERLHLPNYPSLSTQITFSLPLLGSLKACKPEVNWSENHFHEDIHLGFIFSLPNKDDIGVWLFKQIQHQCYKVVNKPTYKYMWERGLLCKYKEEATSHIYYTEDFELYVGCRGLFHSEAMMIIWLALKPLLKVTLLCLSVYPGLVYQTDIEVNGNPLVIRVNSQDTHNAGSTRMCFWSCLNSFLNNDITLSRNECKINLGMLFSSLKENLVSGECTSWADCIYPNVNIEDIIETSYPQFEVYIPEKTKSRKLKACTVSWRPVISEMIDMKSKELLESQKPVTVSSKSANRQLQRIARSLVTSVLASAMATLLTTHGNVSTRQEVLINAVARAARAGYKGDIQLVLKSMNQIMEESAEFALDLEHQEKKSSSKVCMIL